MLCLHFGPIRIGVVSNDSVLLEHLQRRFPGFCSTAASLFTIDHHVNGPVPSDLESALAIRHEPITITKAEQNFTISASTFFSQIDLGRNYATLSAPAALYPIDTLLQHVLPLLAAPGLIIHAAALSDGERGWLASGPSGAGKSTLAALLHEYALCDELALLNYDCDTNELQIHGLPLWRARPGSAALRGIYMLRHGLHHQRRRLAAGDALQRLAREVHWPSLDKLKWQTAFATLAEVVNHIPIWELTFAPRADVWSFIVSEDYYDHAKLF